MKIYRGGRTSKKWSKTDGREIDVSEWRRGKIIVVDGTINKSGSRHTDLGVEIEPTDIVALSAALIRNYKELESENVELKSSIKKMNDAFRVIASFATIENESKKMTLKEAVDALKMIHKYAQPYVPFKG